MLEPSGLDASPRLETIRDRLGRQITRSTLLFLPVLVAAGTVGALVSASATPRFLLTTEGWVVVVAGIVYLIWWLRLTRFPCPHCGTNLWTRKLVPHACPSCGISLDTPER